MHDLLNILAVWALERSVITVADWAAHKMIHHD